MAAASAMWVLAEGQGLRDRMNITLRLASPRLMEGTHHRERWATGHVTPQHSKSDSRAP
jgi:hypothetical protein